MTTPTIDLDVIEWLASLFPDQVPQIDTSDREVWAKVGEQRVVRLMRRVFEQQNEDILNQKVIL